MANPTTNYGFVLPTSSDLVTDLPADFDVALQGVDTRLKALQPGTTLGDLAYSSATANTNTRLPIGTNGQVLSVSGGVPAWSAAGMSNPMTTTGDTIYSSSGSTPARLGIGSTGQVLTVAGGVPSWESAATFNPNYQLLNAGGTALTGSNTITISSISAKTNLLVYVTGASSVNGGSVFTLRMNGDDANYVQLGGAAYSDSSNFFGPDTGATNGVNLGRLGSNSAANTVNAFIKIDGANSAGLKVFSSNGNASGTSDARSYAMQGYYSGTSAVTSISIVSSSGNFDAGTIFVYGA